MVDEVPSHMKEMPEVGAVCPKPKPVVQCCHAGTQEGWRSTLL